MTCHPMSRKTDSAVCSPMPVAQSGSFPWLSSSTTHVTKGSLGGTHRPVAVVKSGMLLAEHDSMPSWWPMIMP